LVEFFMAEREAQVVRLGGEEGARSKPASTAATAAARPPLDPELERALATLVAAGLNPKVVAVRPNRRDVTRAS
jgi:hypothetical protein